MKCMYLKRVFDSTPSPRFLFHFQVMVKDRNHHLIDNTNKFTRIKIYTFTYNPLIL